MLPGALANHLPSALACEGTADTQIAGGAVEHLIGLGPAGGLYCHFPLGCPTPDPCTFDIAAVVSGAGLVEGVIAPFDGDDARCGPVAFECTVTATLASGALHELHLTCGFGELTFAVDVTLQCKAGLA